MKSPARVLSIMALAAAGAAFAQGYPNRPIKVVVPWPPGQATDTVARVLTERMGTVLGQQLVIDNRPGAGVRAWIGLIGPSGIPRDVRSRLASECQKAVHAADIQEKLFAAGLEPDSLPMEEIAGYLRKQGDRFGAVARQANIRLD